MGRYSNVKKGYALDLSDGNYYNSGWERDYARFLTYLEKLGVIEGWEYEPYEFSFQGLGYKRGPFVYKPDFAVKFSPSVHLMSFPIKAFFEHAEPNKVVFVEVKGRETGQDRNKWKRFRKHTEYPLEVVKRPEMIQIQSMKDDIPGWESRVY